ncbi:MAG TPA: alginate export family protein [Opitutaceae bacterium]|nr:alginate export family protein [Opitutaceae bacterium]
MPIRDAAFVLVLAAASAARAQYVPPSPPGPVPGAVDDRLRAADPTFKAWDIGVNERLRSENKSGAGTTHAGSNYDFALAPPTTNSNHYWLSRLMPRIGYTGDWIAAVVEARSSYSFGDNRYNPTAAGAGLSENDGPLQGQLGYVALGNLKKFPLTLKVGRQELTYGDQRLVGSAFWLNTPRTFDAVKVRYQHAQWGVDLFAANVVYGRRDHFNQSNSQDTLSGAYLDFPGLWKTAVVEAYLFARNVGRAIVTDDWSQIAAPFRMTAPQDLYTLGFRTKSKPGAHGPWDYGIEAMWQFGDRTAVFPATPVAAALAAPRLDQDAWAFVLQGGYTWKGHPLKPRLALIVSAASGDRSSADRRSGTFQNLLPSNHGLYGAMDLSSLQNIEDFRLSLSFKPGAAASLAFDVHQQFLETTHDYWYNPAGVPRNTPGAAVGSGRGFGLNPDYRPDLGQEIDVVFGWTVTRGLLLEAGAGHFFRGNYIKQSFQAVGSKDANYLYLQATVNL